MRFSIIAPTAFLTFTASSYAAVTPTLGGVVARTDSTSSACGSGSASSSSGASGIGSLISGLLDNLSGSASGSGELGTLLSGLLSSSGNTEILNNVASEIQTVLTSVMSGSGNVDVAEEVTSGLKNISAMFDGNTAVTGAMSGAINIVGQLNTLAGGYAGGNATASTSIPIIGNVLGEFESMASGLGLNVTGSSDASAYTSILTKIASTASTLLSGYANTDSNVSVSNTLSSITSMYGLVSSLAGAFTGGATDSTSANTDLSGAINTILSFCNA